MNSCRQTRLHLEMARRERIPQRMLWKELVAFVRDHASRVYGHVPQPGDRRGIVLNAVSRMIVWVVCQQGRVQPHVTKHLHVVISQVVALYCCCTRVATRVRLLRPVSIGARIGIF